MQTREYYFDNLKFLLIVFVVIGHMIEPLIFTDKGIKALYYWLYSFHMPLFIFITGYFSKNISSEKYGKSIVEKLIIPYLIFQCLYKLCDFFLFKREQLEFHFFTPYWLLWFLFSLIIWKIILPYVAKVKYIVVWSIMMTIIIGYASDAGYYASIARTFVFFPFFIMGYLFDKRYISYLKKKSIKVISVMILVGVGLYFYFQSYHINRKWLYGSVNFENLGFDMWYAGMYRLILLALAIVMGIAVLSLTPRKHIPLISERGRYTVTVYLFHGFIIKYLATSTVYSSINSYFSKLLLIFGSIVLVLLLSTPAIYQYLKFLVYPTLLKKSGNK